MRSYGRWLRRERGWCSACRAAVPTWTWLGAAAAAGLRFVLAHGETAAAIMAATYADLTGTPGAVVVTRGPGLASAVNGIAHAALDRLPVVVIADTVAAAGLVTGGTMEWPLLAAADLIIGLGVDEAEMIPAPWDYAARTILVTEPAASPPGSDFTGAATARMPLDRAAQTLAEVLAVGTGHDWPPDAGRAAKTDAAARLTAAAIAAPGLLAPQQVVATVRARTPPETIATVDAGAHMLVAMPLWEVPEPRRLLVSSGLATMGYALPAAIAAALCAPRVPVVAFTGDGGLGMTLAEIETAVRLSLRVIVIVFNDAALSLIKLKQKPAGQGGAEAVSYRPVSFAAAATAMGAAAAAVTTEQDLATALAAALRRPGPTVIDASVDPASYPAVMDLSRGQAGRRSVPGISRALGVPCP